MTPARRRSLRRLGLRCFRLVRRHYVTFVSVAVLAIAAVLALTNTSFQRPPPPAEGVESIALSSATASPAATPAPTSTPRHKAVVYVVQDEEHGNALLETHNAVMWDAHQAGGGPRTPFPDVYYVVAGTPELQTQAIQRINNFIDAATIQQIDLIILDLRPGRGFPPPQD